jgi:alkanesulfonate monooxygenase SsuD/methylene tetrahydromethanopterin reductase-like flavin-dependent oxidoreductase (luciferase family)
MSVRMAILHPDWRARGDHHGRGPMVARHDVPVRYGLIVNAGDPRELADIAALAEAAGWDGVFSFDAIAIGDIELYDPWVVLAAMAMRTERVRLGLIVAAPSRRRPWKLARETMTLDHLSGGRLILPVGLGTLDDAGFGNVGEPTGARTRAELLDEALEILEGLWSGEPFAYAGRHHRFGAMTFRPPPVQRPRIPIWVVGAWPHERSMRRVLRWDGIVTQTGAPDEVRAIAAYVARERDPAVQDRAFEIVVQGSTPADDPDAAAEAVRAYLGTGATWWIDADWDSPTVDSVRRRAMAGPPRP